MSIPTLDPDGQAREALASAVTSFGPRILSNPQMLENVFTDLLPDAPREVSILVAAAQVDVAAMLQDRIAQHMDPDTAVRLTSSALGERRGLDGVACLWATTEFARALGHPVSEAAPPPPPEPETGRVASDRGWEPESEVPRESAPPPPPPPPPPTDTPPPSDGMRPPAGSAPDDQTVTQGPGPSGSAGFPPRAPRSGEAPQGPGTGEPPLPTSSRRRLVIPGAVALVVLVVVLVVVLAGHHGPQHHDTTTTTVTTSPPTTAPSTTVPPTTAPAIQTLYNLAPGDDQDPTTCAPFEKVSTAEAATVRLGLRCADPDLNDYVYGLQFDNAADYGAGVANFNSFYGFDANTADTSCPPSTGTQGLESYGFSDDNLPATSGQVLECFFEPSLDGYFYMWTLPTQNSFLWTFNTNFSDIESWWSGGFPDPQF